MSRPFRTIFIFGLLAMTLLACSVTKHYQPPGIDYMDTFRGVGRPDTTRIASLSWRQVFNDTVLQSVIDRGIAQNLDLQTAYTRIRQAQAYYKQSKAAFLPVVDANTSAGRLRLSKAQNFGIVSNVTEYQMGLSTSWKLDIWGRLSSAKKASLASLLATEAGTR